MKMESEIFFCDTYALMELVFGTESYLPYSNATLVTSDQNLMEMYYSLLRNYGETIADEYFEEFYEMSLQFPSFLIKPAMEFKLLHKKDRLSYVDCMGYAFSLAHGMKFLTGDIKFEKKENVEFVR